MTDPQFTAGICSVALPLIAGVHRFAVDYGYRGLETTLWRSARSSSRYAPLSISGSGGRIERSGEVRCWN